MITTLSDIEYEKLYFTFRFGFLIRSNLVLENEVKALYVIEIGNITFNFIILKRYKMQIVSTIVEIRISKQVSMCLQKVYKILRRSLYFFILSRINSKIIILNITNNFFCL